MYEFFSCVQAVFFVLLKKECTMIKTTVGIDGMMCSMCEAHVNDTIRKAFEVKSVKSSHKKGETEIISENPIDEDKLRKAMEPTGYAVTAISSQPYEKKKLFGLFG